MKSNMLGLYGIGMIIICAVAVQAISRTNNKIQNGTAIQLDASVAETKVPIKYVSSGYKNGNEEGFAKKSQFKDGDGYDTLETHGNQDKDKYGFVSEQGFGSRKTGESGTKPKVQKHSYKKTKKQGNDWDFRNAGGFDEESHEETKGLKKKTYKKTHEKPARSYRSSSYPPRSAKLVASPTDKLYDFSMTYGNPATGYQQQSRSLPPLPRLTNTRTDTAYQPTYTSAPNKRGVSHLTDYGNGFQTQIYHNPNAFNQGPVLFNQQPVLASHEDVQPAPVTEKKAGKSKRRATPHSNDNKKARKGKKYEPEKNAKYSEYDGVDLNDGSVENDGGESGADYDTNDYAYNDYGSGEANDGGDYEEEGNDGGEEDSAEANDYDYESNDYDYDEGAEEEKKNNKKEKDEEEGAEHDDDSDGEYTQVSPDYHGRFIYASEADKDATYQ